MWIFGPKLIFFFSVPGTSSTGVPVARLSRAGLLGSDVIQGIWLFIIKKTSMSFFRLNPFENRTPSSKKYRSNVRQILFGWNLLRSMVPTSAWNLIMGAQQSWIAKLITWTCCYMLVWSNYIGTHVISKKSNHQGMDSLCKPKALALKKVENAISLQKHDKYIYICIYILYKAIMGDTTCNIIWPSGDHC